MRLSSAILSVLGLIPVCVEPVRAENPGLPDSPAGRVAEAWLRLFDDGSADTVQAFEERYRAAAAAEREPLSARVRRFQNLRERWGTARLERVVDDQECYLALLVKLSPSGNNFLVEFDLEPSPPHGVLDISARGPLDAGQIEAALAPVDAQRRENTIRAVARELRESYVYPDIGAKMAAALEAHLSTGRYSEITRPTALGRKLTEDVRAIQNDKHLRIRSRIPIVRLDDANGPGRNGPPANFGFARVEILPGNVGYLKFTAFVPTDDAKQVAAAAMAFLARCDALVFDVRENGGGSAEMIAYLSSFLFEPGRHLNSFRDRNGNQTGATVTHDAISGKRFAAELPVYVLTSAMTFSAAEEFTYNLQQTRRATIVGERTGGGAHPVTLKALNRQIELSIPFERAENAISKTNWEGVGVVPEIAVPAEKALDAALSDALKRLADAKQEQRPAESPPPTAPGRG